MHLRAEMDSNGRAEMDSKRERREQKWARVERAAREQKWESKRVRRERRKWESRNGQQAREEKWTASERVEMGSKRVASRNRSSK